MSTTLVKTVVLVWMASTISRVTALRGILGVIAKQVRSFEAKNLSSWTQFLTLISWNSENKQIHVHLYKPLQIGNAKNPPLNRSSKYKPPGGLYLENVPQIRSKNKAKTVILLPTIRVAQSILKRKFPSVDNPSEHKPLKKGLWKI